MSSEDEEPPDVDKKEDSDFVMEEDESGSDWEMSNRKSKVKHRIIMSYGKLFNIISPLWFL